MKNQKKNQKGQMAVEMVLMTALFVFFAVGIVATGFKENEYFANLVSTPWKSLAGLIQNGVWGTPENTMSKHPNRDRINSVRGDDVK